MGDHKFMFANALWKSNFIFYQGNVTLPEVQSSTETISFCLEGYEGLEDELTVTAQSHELGKFMFANGKLYYTISNIILRCCS